MAITCLLHYMSPYMSLIWRCFHIGLGNLHKPCSVTTAPELTSCKEQGLMYNTVYKQFGNILNGLKEDLNYVSYIAHN